MGFNNVFFENYDPRNHPCKDCKERHAFCHGHCDKEREFNETKPKKPYTSTFTNNVRKVHDPFHKKGRVITNGRR